MQITVDEQDLKAILELIDVEFDRLYRKTNTNRAMALNDLRERLQHPATVEHHVICPLCQEITCDWDCPNPRGGHQEEKPEPDDMHGICLTCGGAGYHQGPDNIDIDECFVCHGLGVRS